MRYAIISDIHSNYEALTAVIADIEMRKIQEIICLGDIVGYGASPKECIQLVRNKCCKVVMGNHDHAVLGLTNKEFFNINAKKAVEWTAGQLEKNDFEYLSHLPFIIKQGEIIFTHANLSSPEEWGYVLDEYEAESSFYLMREAGICFIGHSHVPLVFEKENYVSFLGYLNNWKLKSQCKYIVNVGSVGQPRDGNNLSAYVIYDSESKEVELIRVPYDIRTAQRKILDAGLPLFLAERIQYGR